MSLPVKPMVAEAMPGDVEELARRVSEHPTYGSDQRLKGPETLARFVIARQHNLDQAYAMWQEWAAWRVEAQPELVALDEVKHVTANGLAGLEGCDKYGRPCIMLRPRHHDPSRWPLPDVIRTAYYYLEQGTKKSEQVADGRIIVLWEHSGAGMRNWDTALFIKRPGLIHILKNNYPESLHGLYIVNANWVFRLFFKALSPFLDERTKHKIHVLDRVEQLLEHARLEDLADDIQALIRTALGTTTATDEKDKDKDSGDAKEGDDP